MRILQIMAGNSYGGAETAFCDISIAMAESGQDVEIITRPNKNRVPILEKAGLTVHTLPFGGKIDIYTPRAIKKIIDKFEPDIVQTWMSRASTKTPKYQEKSGHKPYITVARLGGYYKLKYFQNTQYFIANTPGIYKYLRTEGITEDHAHYISNFAETDAIDTPINRADMGTPQDATLLLSLGRLHHDKAFDTLIKSVSKLPETVHLWIAGEGPDRKDLEQLISTLNLGHRVTLLGWRNDRSALLQACDICVLPSRDEPFGTVFVQAWAQNTPVIATNTDGPREFIRSGEDGLIIPIDDEPALIKAIKKLSQDKDLAQKLAKNGFTRYKNEFTKEKTIKEYVDFYQSILKKESKTP